VIGVRKGLTRGTRFARMRDVARNNQSARQTSSRLIDEKGGVRAGPPRRPASRSGGLARLAKARNLAQHDARGLAGQTPGTQSDRECLGIPARQLAVKPDLPILRRSPRPLLRILEQTPRSALAHHVPRLAPRGARVLVRESWRSFRSSRATLLLARAKERATIKEIVRRTGYSRGRSNVKRLRRARPSAPFSPCGRRCRPKADG
jgi:hypothetical protein